MAEEKIKVNDFVELEYTGRNPETGGVFDTTSLEVAKANKLSNQDVRPVRICVGRGHVVKGLDDAIPGKKPDIQFKVVVPPELGFGKKSTRLLQLISTGKFRAQKINPVPGMPVNIDGAYGVVKTVTGGRTIVDFNHPLSGRTLEYEAKVSRIISETQEKLAVMVDLLLGPSCSGRVEEGKAVIELPQEVPQDFKDRLSKEIALVIPELKEIAVKSATTVKESKNANL
ncbi:FKBP-type peptidyl-prolyl cis-trans isomerase [Candidatus Woesearchaeota archaeon]|nr:FKBP-type peptidyl-prolyl cis-trans isomerase [Candidatus Woesearchaeota archaeon]